MNHRVHARRPERAAAEGQIDTDQTGARVPDRSAEEDLQVDGGGREPEQAAWRNLEDTMQWCPPGAHGEHGREAAEEHACPEVHADHERWPAAETRGAAEQAREEPDHARGHR